MIEFISTCTYEKEGTPDVWDEDNGGWIPGVPGETVIVPCNASPSGSGEVTKAEDGTMVSYAFNLSFPFEIERIPQWKNVIIKDRTGHVLIEDKLKRFHVGRYLVNKGWI